ncbi:hypothetical protein [Rhizobium sp.]|jgi:hypothetical protein|uniref:hypothetical protein n=1 Tax=Rhizobium sp. TaxID=391 RepID=UPI000E8454CB|nr:hypothetical protein [Rhizobium sp.]
MTYEIKTPILKTIADGTLGVFNEAINGKADIKQGDLAVRAATSIRRAVEIDLRVRLAAPKLTSAERANNKIAE